MAIRFRMPPHSEFAETASEFLQRIGRPELVRFVLFNDNALAAFRDAMKSLKTP